MNGKMIARLVEERFCVLTPSDCGVFKDSRKKFEEKIDARMVEWQKKMAPLRGVRAISYHKSFSYFAERFGLRVVNTIEPKPGIPPSAGHVRDLVSQMRAEGVRLILMEPNRERKTPAFLANETGAKIAMIPSMVGGTREAWDYLSLFDFIIETLVAAAGA